MHHLSPRPRSSHRPIDPAPRHADRRSTMRVRALWLPGLLGLLSVALPGAASAAHPSGPVAPPPVHRIPGTNCAVFPADNIWNTDISTLPVNSHSAAWLASMNAGTSNL